MRIPALADLGLVELRNASPLVAQMLRSGALFAFRHGPTLLNQLLPDPAEAGLFRLLLRVHGPAGGISSSHGLVGPGLDFAHATGAARWVTAAAPGLQCTTTLQLHPRHSAWLWRVKVRNASSETLRVDVLHAQDLGLGDEGAVRNNEAYTSHYIDLQPQRDDALGWTILARQNQAAAGGRHPWLAFACATGAEAYCTDGWQFFGADHRLTQAPAAVRATSLPSKRLQYEFALAGLQSRAAVVAPGAEAEFSFVALFIEDHPSASSAADLRHLRELPPSAWPEPSLPLGNRSPVSLFGSAPWRHGEQPSAAELAAWFPGPARHAETATGGAALSFFCGDDTHVVTREKEAQVARAHGHILRNGNSSWIDDDQFGVTCYAAGIFGAQVFLGNPSLNRLLPVVRNSLNLARACGQRVFVRAPGGQWEQLGVPSAFAMTPGDARWIYRHGESRIEARVWCSSTLPASFLELRVTEGPRCEFLVSHQLVLGSSEFEHGGEVTIRADEGWLTAVPDPASLVARHQPGAAFAIAAADAGTLATMGGSEMLYPDSRMSGGTHAVLQTRAVASCTVIMLGGFTGAAGLPAAVQAARAECANRTAAARPTPLRLGLSGTSAAGAARLAEIIPWFNHNASIHFSSPHGLEQYGGAAWGVRDVCQGSVEWLLAAGRLDIVRRTLLAVFAQQHREDGTWPQWFMHEPYRFIRQAHSHGDICFWPVKALCDYAEVANDLSFLEEKVDYCDPKSSTATGPTESLWTHCDRVIAHCESRFLAGTALVNYGDGDWDDTLQPADPAMRTGMTSAWTVALAFHTFRQLAAVSRRAGQAARAERLEAVVTRMRADFATRLMPDGIVAGFLLNEKGSGSRPLLHPSDKVTGIRYRLLPMTRSILAELFTREEADRHLALIERELRYPDGVRLMSEPAAYHDGLETLFKRAETAANIGREVGLQYVHAHLRYLETLAKVGDADRLWWALQVVNPVALTESVPHAAPRQSNVYFSSSDADFADRHEASRRWSELRGGKVAVRAGWRLYSSGPGIFLHKVRSCLLGVRESFGEIVFDPVLPRELDGLAAELELLGRPVTVHYRVQSGTHSPAFLLVNGRRLEGRAESNPYRKGGLRVAAAQLEPLLTPAANRIDIQL